MAIATLVDNQNRFSDLLEQHQGIVGKVTTTYCWHPDDRDELSQEIFTQLWRAVPSYDDTQLFSTWMYRVALNISISWVRRNSIRQRHMTTLGDDVHEVADTSSAPAENWLPANIVVGVLGMVLTVVGFHWARRSSRPGVRARVERMASGASIDKAKRLLADIERFEQDAG